LHSGFYFHEVETGSQMGVTDGRIIKAMFVGVPLISLLPTEAMNIPFDFPTIIHLAAVFLGMASGIVVLFFALRKNPANLPLALGQICLSFAVLISLSIVTKLMAHWPFLFRLGNLFGLLFVPFPFLYLSFNISKRRWKWYDTFHFIPVIVYTIDFWPVLMMPPEQKSLLVLQELRDLNKFALFRESRFFGIGFYQIFRTLLFTAYWLIQMLLFIGWAKKMPIKSRENKIWKNWISFFLIFQFLLWFPIYLTLFWLKQEYTYHIFNTTVAIWLTGASLAYFFYPSLLHGQNFQSNEMMPEITKKSKRHIYQEDNLLDKKMLETMLLIEKNMNEGKLFLKQGYSINDFSRDIELPVYQISKCLNHLIGWSFVDFINQKRISFCKEKFDQGEWMNLTLEAVSESCGFTNRNSFTKAFQKFEGLTPSAYRLKGQNQEGLLS
jgi:AraC-like DNA-binding protein